MNVLEIRDLSVDYLSGGGAVHAVADVSLDLRRGEILGLAGESGSGKSTLANAVARLLRPPAAITSGSVVYRRQDGSSEDVLALGRKELRAFRWKELAVVFQSAMNALNPVSTVGAQIDDVLRIHRPGMSRNDRAERAAELLQRVGISADRRRAYPHELSGGMRQRAAIAIALALNPEVIIMDEPTTALDVVVQRDILHEIRALREEYGFAVVFITHDLSLLMEISDRIAIMYAGRVVETGGARAIHTSPRHPYTLGLLRSFPRLHGPREQLLGIPGTPPDLRSLPPGCAFHPRCGKAMAECSSELPALDGDVACLLNGGRGLEDAS
ncbi:ATP-binding cassette domain-containing protein [Nonomuraea phyllanthi]|uniref:ATP-binding cassette domain-containing protein n=1 Tax=Nonomuraea phyllanthi TaxID=2219224 RepID=A0A5C4VLM6_9ACTN|nr:ABC transporter ATP-binding protein [Nonomuraea phyllanthi]KAB8189326.1 ATP-binding cassette domain-containing protein [Nonomuraea phyllanthi]QFY11762.1 ATP-binding cassette domain-containing protein [Nonomuraea phyllanthi]